MRDLTLESLPQDEKASVEIYAERFADSFQNYDPQIKRHEAVESAKDLISRVWIYMGPQAPPFHLSPGGKDTK